ncbi:MAG TPA: FtsX-like permease family protein, partial [Polyangiaceae bacterium]|nr:FtsX-like permease family protein [Polyangiaceae bacterium]
MTLTGLAVRNLARNKFRVILTSIGVAIAIVAFLLLRTVVWAWASGADFAAKDRIVTRHKVTFVMTLPKRYVEDVRNSPHIKEVTWANWFGAKDPKHDNEFFSTLAIDPATYFQVYSEMKVPPDQLDTFKHDRQGAIVGDVLAKKLGWKVGDKIALQSGIYPGDWQFNIDGIYTATAKSVDRSTLVFPWEYMNDSLPERGRDRVGWLVSRVDDPAHVADIGVALDRVFDDRDTQTLSQDESSFNKSFLAMFSAVITAMDLVSAVILVIMTLIIGNTIAMGVRERTNEYGVLKALGFTGGHIALFVIGESVLIALIGGAIGIGLSYPFIEQGM